MTGAAKLAPLVHARLKQAVRSVIGACGNISGSAATTGKSESTVGNWNNRNMADLPTLGDAFLLDEVAMMQGQRPAVLSAYAQELGAVVIFLPDGGAADGEIGLMLMDVVRETGELADRIRTSLADGKIDGIEPAEIEREAAELCEAASLIRARARAMQGKVVVAVNDRAEGER